MNYVVFYFLKDQVELFQLAAVLQTGGHDIDAGGFNTAVAQDVRQLGDVLFDAIKGPGEELAQIVGKHFGWIYSGNCAELFHLRPNITSVKGSAGSGNKDYPIADAAFFCIVQ